MTIAVVLLSLINIASSTALNAILSLSTLALYVSYMIPITLMTIKRLRRQPLEFGPFSLGRFGLPINVFALVYGIFVSIFLPFPPTLPVTGETMNYSGPIFGLVLLFALADWLLRGRKFYTGPIREVAEAVSPSHDTSALNTSTPKDM